MQISKNQQLFGYPALEIRRLMRACQDTRWIGVVGLTLHISRDRATELVEAMLVEGLVAKALDRECSREWLMIVEDPHGPRYVNTIKGNALASASAKPIRRSTAERLVSSLLQRVEKVNGDPNLLHWVDEVVVFGSFLRESEMLGDVDLALAYTCRIDNLNEYHELRKARVKEAEANGRSFQGFLDQLKWPGREIELRLRNRSCSLSLHYLERERTFIEAIPHRRIYLRSNCTPITASD